MLKYRKPFLFFTQLYCSVRWFTCSQFIILLFDDADDLSTNSVTAAVFLDLLHSVWQTDTSG